MPLLFVFVGIALLLILMLKYKFDAFFSLLITAFAVGVLNRMEIYAILDSILQGIGDTMGNIILILVFGAMLGKLIESSGAANVIAERLTSLFGVKYIQYAITLTAFLVGLPMMYNASFLVLIPLVYTLASGSRIPLMYIGIPLSATLSIAHGYLPPSPAPVYTSFVFGADINHVLLLGLVPVIPACFLSGIWFSRLFKKVRAVPPPALYQERSFKKEELPGLGLSVFVTISPVLLMLIGALIDLLIGIDVDYFQYLSTLWGESVFVSVSSSVLQLFKFLSNANMALFSAVIIAIFSLGFRQGAKMPDVMASLSKSVSSIAMIILIIAAGGAFKQVLTDSGVSEYIKSITTGLDFNPYILGWVVAAVIRLAIGSATVATMTAAGIMLPVMETTGVNPELLVIATGSGSLMFSHFNDVGFWMFKEYFNITIKQTFAIWTVMECIVAIVGLCAVLLMSYFI